MSSTSKTMCNIVFLLCFCCFSQNGKTISCLFILCERRYLLLGFESSLHILDTSSLSYMWFLNILSHLTGCLFILLMVSFVEKKFLILMFNFVSYLSSRFLLCIYSHSSCYSFYSISIIMCVKKTYFCCWIVWYLSQTTHPSGLCPWGFWHTCNYSESPLDVNTVQEKAAQTAHWVHRKQSMLLRGVTDSGLVRKQARRSGVHKEEALSYRL